MLELRSSATALKNPIPQSAAPRIKALEKNDENS